MDYKEKYEELVEAARAVVEGNPGLCNMNKRLCRVRDLLPEKESDDERIRKEMIEYFHGCIQRNKKTGFRIEQIKNWIAYLEKQKEQKPALYWHKIKAYDHLPCRAYIYKFAYEQENNFRGECHIDGFLMPNEPVKIGCDTWYLPVEDIKNLPKENELDTASPMKTIEQKPAEWSEEDEYVYNEILKRVADKKLYEHDLEYIYKWFKSLRPQPHWKPSEEQIDTLERWLLDNEFKGDSRYVYPIFESLYNDLKKL